MPIPASIASRGLANCTGLPSSMSVPEFGCSIPNRIFISVDLPAPFSPTNRVNLTGFDSKVDAVIGDDTARIDLANAGCLQKCHAARGLVLETEKGAVPKGAAPVCALLDVGVDDERASRDFGFLGIDLGADLGRDKLLVLGILGDAHGTVGKAEHDALAIGLAPVHRAHEGEEERLADLLLHGREDHVGLGRSVAAKMVAWSLSTPMASLPPPASLTAWSAPRPVPPAIGKIMSAPWLSWARPISLPWPGQRKCGHGVQDLDVRVGILGALVEAVLKSVTVGNSMPRMVPRTPLWEILAAA